MLTSHGLGLAEHNLDRSPFLGGLGMRCLDSDKCVDTDVWQLDPKHCGSHDTFRHYLHTSLLGPGAYSTETHPQARLGASQCLSQAAS